MGRAGATEAAIWEDDYKFIRRLGLSGNWSKLQRMHVVASARRPGGNHVLVARVLLDAKQGQGVRYLDGDPLNLRRENLKLMSHAGAIRRDRDYVGIAA